MQLAQIPRFPSLSNFVELGDGERASVSMTNGTSLSEDLDADLQAIVVRYRLTYHELWSHSLS